MRSTRGDLLRQLTFIVVVTRESEIERDSEESIKSNRQSKRRRRSNNYHFYLYF